MFGDAQLANSLNNFVRAFEGAKVGELLTLFRRLRDSESVWKNSLLDEMVKARQ